MTTVKKLVYRVWGMLDGNIEASVESRFTYREIREAILPAIAAAIVKKKNQDDNQADSSKYGNDFESKTYEKVPVGVDDETGFSYLDLPASLVPYFDGRQISITGKVTISFKRSKTYLPIKKQELIIVKYSPCDPDAVMFYNEGKKVMFLGRVEDETLNVTLKGSMPDDDDAELTAPLEFMNDVAVNAYQSLVPQVKQDDNAINGVPNP